jgi:hypothetical protein
VNPNKCAVIKNVLQPDGSLSDVYLVDRQALDELHRELDLIHQRMIEQLNRVLFPTGREYTVEQLRRMTDL